MVISLKSLIISQKSHEGTVFSYILNKIVRLIVSTN